VWGTYPELFQTLYQGFIEALYVATISVKKIEFDVYLCAKYSVTRRPHMVGAEGPEIF
jgi:hypothetical protein